MTPTFQQKFQNHKLEKMRFLAKYVEKHRRIKFDL